eukprot:2793491-Lingulodinium_polyedra.AAC.1
MGKHGTRCGHTNETRPSQCKPTRGRGCRLSSWAAAGRPNPRGTACPARGCTPCGTARPNAPRGN